MTECTCPEKYKNAENKGPHCLAERHGFHFQSDNWCNCRCHETKAAAQARADQSQRCLQQLYEQLSKDGRHTDILMSILNEVGATVSLFGQEKPTYEALWREREELRAKLIADEASFHATNAEAHAQREEAIRMFDLTRVKIAAAGGFDATKGWHHIEGEIALLVSDLREARAERDAMRIERDARPAFTREHARALTVVPSHPDALPEALAILRAFAKSPVRGETSRAHAWPEVSDRKILDLATQLDPAFHLVIRREHSDTGEDLLTAVIMEDPPEGGWIDKDGPYTLHEADRYRETSRVGVSAYDVETISRLTIGMLESHIATRKPSSSCHTWTAR